MGVELERKVEAIEGKVDSIDKRLIETNDKLDAIATILGQIYKHI